MNNMNEISLDNNDRILIYVNGAYYSIEVKDGKLFGHGPHTPKDGINLYGKKGEEVFGLVPEDPDYNQGKG